METAELTAMMAANEINLNDIANHFGINKKYKWEDILLLDSCHLKGIIKESNNKKAYIFPYGSIVFINMEHHEINDVLKYLKTLDNSLLSKSASDIVEKYKIEINQQEKYAIYNDYITIPEGKNFYFEIASTILAKSVALEKIEVDTDALSDKIEEIIEKLNKSNFNVNDKKLASLFAKILTFKYSTISYIMLLDKPDIVWYNEEAEKVFTDMSTLFELDERYEKIRNKTETLMDITEMFTSLAHAKRGTRLEWIVIILIFVEIIMTLLFEFIPGLK